MVSRYSRSLFLLAITVYTLFLIYTSFSYSPEARMFPLIANVLLVGLILLEALVQRFEDRIDVPVGGVFSGPTEGSDVLADEDEHRNVRREVEMVGWIFGFIVAIWLFGFLAAVLLVPLFVYVYRRDRRLVVYTFLAVLILLNTFVYLLSARLWDGVLFELL
jgi:hypothetical protein